MLFFVSSVSKSFHGVVASKTRCNGSERIDSRIHQPQSHKGVGGRGGGGELDQQRKPEGADDIVFHTVYLILTSKEARKLYGLVIAVQYLYIYIYMCMNMCCFDDRFHETSITKNRK